MRGKKQLLLLEYLISSADVFALCSSIIKPSYFDPEFRNAVAFIKEYYTKFNTTPDSKQIEAESGTLINKTPLTRDQISYCSTEIETFCRHKAMQEAILSAAADLSQNEEDADFGKIQNLVKDAITTTIHKSVGIDYFADPLQRLKDANEKHRPISTGWKELDKFLGGGIHRQQMILFSANSGGGKSIAMANIGLNFMEQGLNVLFLSLELPVNLIAKRFDAMISGIHVAEMDHRISETAEKILNKKQVLGKLFIEHMPMSTTNSNDIRAFLKEFELRHEFIPDILIVDYVDVMASNEKVSGDNISAKDRAVSEQLYSIGRDYNLILVTASQQNRSAIGVDDINQSHIAGGLGKINITDNHISIVSNDAMKARGEIAFKLIKTRSSDGVNKYVNLNWNNKTLRITDGLKSGPSNGPELVLNKVTKQSSSLEDIIAENLN